MSNVSNGIFPFSVTLRLATVNQVSTGSSFRGVVQHPNVAIEHSKISQKRRMPMRRKNVKRSRASTQTHSKCSTPSQFILNTRNLVPVAKSVPVAKIKNCPSENQRKNRSYSTWKHETTKSFLKPPLVSTSGLGFPPSELQDWIQESQLAINIHKASKSSLKNKMQGTMPIWQKLKQYRELKKMQQSESEHERLPFPYNPDVWKIQSGSSLLSMDSILTLPQMQITSWESSIVTPESILESNVELEIKNKIGNDQQENDNEKPESVMEEFSESSNSSTLSKSIANDSQLILSRTVENDTKLIGHSISCDIRQPRTHSALSKFTDQNSKLILITSPDESQCSISTESDQMKIKDVLMQENIIWQGMGCMILPGHNKIAPASLSTLVTTVQDSNLDDRNACKRRYSWQVVDTGLQTSRTLLEDLIKMEHERMEKEREENASLKCNYKYSWQIIGIETQTSPQDYEESKDRFELKSKPRDSASWKASPRRPRETTDRRVKFCTNEQTQTCASKENQTNFTEIYAMSRKTSAKIYI